MTREPCRRAGLGYAFVETITFAHRTDLRDVSSSIVPECPSRFIAWTAAPSMIVPPSESKIIASERQSSAGSTYAMPFRRIKPPM